MFAGVIVDIANANVDRIFSYHIPEDMPIECGMHVLVPFGRGNSTKEGFVLSLTEEAPAVGTVKDILRPIEPYTVLLPEQIELAHWIRHSYNCLLIDALRLMIPSVLRGGKAHEKIERTVSVAEGIDVAAVLSSMLRKDGSISSPKQYEVLKLLSESDVALASADIDAFIPGSRPAVRALIKKGILTESGHITFRRPQDAFRVPDKPVTPTEEQRTAIDAITRSCTEEDAKTFLLHGVTGSGKTEVYLRCIEHCLAQDKQAVVLVPEISLTPQTVGRFSARFGDSVAVLHSRLSTGERFDEWRRIRLGKARVVIGARSAVFAPMENIGIIIIDEEHEASYQSEKSPRYQAAEIARFRCDRAKAPLILGSATPSLTSYFRAEAGRYTLLELKQRVMDRPLPAVDIIDMREEFLSGNNGIFSGQLVRLLRQCFADGKQAMLFLNRRGYSTFVSCRACGTVIQCPNCDISMTYHKADNILKCHYCGAVRQVPETCPQCGRPFIKYFGIGTEQVEEQFLSLFPDVKTLRMDADTIKQKGSHADILSRFAAGEAQVLIGTQMIAKGHDFPNVTLVGVIAADAALCIPDYRSTERTFQLLEQVAGRAGRDQYPGHVVIQTYTPGHPVIRYAREHDYRAFYRYELAERRKAIFPPYSMFLRILFSGPDIDALAILGEQYRAGLEEALHQAAGDEKIPDILMLVSSPAPIKRKQGVFRYQILIKLLRTKRTGALVHAVYRYINAHANEQFAVLEINPQDMF